MATIVSQGASATVSLPAGSNIAVTGTGFAVMGPGRLQGTQYGLQGSTRVGPFDTAQTVYLTSTTTALSYTIAPGYVGAGPVQTARNADGTPSGLIDPATGQAVGVSAFQGASIAPVTTSSVIKQLPKTTAALQLTAMRKKPTIALVDGDSTEAGLGTNTGTNGWVGARKMTHAAQLARLLGWQDSGVLGCGCGTDVSPDQYDERVSLGSGVSVNFNVSYLGASLIVFASGATGAYTITPRGSKGFDRVRVLYGKQTAGAATNMSVLVGGTSIGTFSSLGTAGVYSVEFPCTYAGPSSPIAISGNAAATDGSCFILGVIWYDSADPGVIVLNGGASGAKCADKLSTGNNWTFKNAYPVLAPDLVLENMWINDTYYATAPATYQSQLGQLRTLLTASADVVWLGYQPINQPNMDNGQGAAIFAAMQAVAGTDPVLDLRNVFGQTFAAANALGIYYDTLHITSKGQYYKACYTASAIAP